MSRPRLNLVDVGASDSGLACRRWLFCQTLVLGEIRPERRSPQLSRYAVEK
jgi:hypothetical protein